MAIAELTMNIETGRFEKAKKPDFLTGMYENSRGAHKQFSWLSSLTRLAGEVFESIKDTNAYMFSQKITKATGLGASLASMPESVIYGIKSVRAWADLTSKQTGKMFEKAFASSLKAANRFAEATMGLMKLGIVDSAKMMGFKCLNSGTSIILDVLIIKEACQTDRKIAKCADRALKDLWQLENNFVLMKGIVGFVFHSVMVGALLCSAAVSFHMVTGLATIFTYTVLASIYLGIERKDLENRYAVEIANKTRSPIG